MKDQFKLIGIWNFKTVDNRTGKILQEETIHNTIVNNGLERLAKLLNGVSSTYIRAIAIGTGNTAATTSDTALETEDQRDTASLSYEADYKAKFTHTFEFLGATSVTEAGLFDSATASGSVMFNRTVFAAKECSADVDLIVTATITVARA